MTKDCCNKYELQFTEGCITISLEKTQEGNPVEIHILTLEFKKKEDRDAFVSWLKTIFPNATYE